MRSKTNIIFIGTSEFAVSILEDLIKSSLFNISAVITAPDRPAGRKKELNLSPIKKTALKHKLKVFQPEKIIRIKKEISTIKPILIVLASYGQIIPKDILEIPTLGIINIHPSLLPKYRGSSPIQTAILNGDKYTGISIMLIDEKVDHGPIIAQLKVPILSSDNKIVLEKKLSKKSAKFLIKILPKYLKKQIKPKTQDKSKASYTKILTRQDGKIDWGESAKSIAQKVKAFYPWPGAWTIINNKRVKILKAKVVNKKIKLEIVQPEGKKPMTGEEFFRGCKVKMSQNNAILLQK